MLCEDHSGCLSYDYSMSQKRFILHNGIEGPPSAPGDDFVNTFETLPLQVSQDFVHHEALGKGHATMYTLSGLDLKHRQSFFVNLRLRNELGYTNVVSSTSVLVDLTPPTPGRVRNVNETLEKKDCGDSFNIVHECKGETTIINNHRYCDKIYMKIMTTLLLVIVFSVVDRIIYDGEGSDTVFNGPTPLYDALYTKANNFLAGT